MKHILAIMTVLSTLTYAQDRETLQPESIYRANHVKSRVQYWLNQPSKSKQVTYYDTLGRLTDFMLTDNESGTTNQMHIIYHYDSKGRQCGYTNKDFIDSTTEEVIYQFDKLNRIVKAVHKTEGILSAIENIYYHPWVETSIQFDDKGNVVQKDTAYFENRNVYYKYSGFAIRDDKKSTWSYMTKTAYDSSGRLSRFEFLNFINNYYYDERGLLIKELSDTPQSRLVTVFDYTYYKN